MNLKQQLGIWGLVMALFACNGKLSDNQSAVVVTDSIAKPLAAINAKIEAAPKEAINYFNRANYYLASKEFELAYKDAQTSIQLDSSKGEYFVLLSDLHFISGKTSISKSLLEKALKIDSKCVPAYLKLAELYLYVKEYTKSIAQLDEALKINKYNAKAYFLKGMNFKEMGDTTRAVSSFQTTVEQDPEYYHAYMQLANLSAIKNSKTTLDFYNSALNINAKSTEALYGKGMYYQMNGDFDKAVEMYQMILQLEPMNRNAHFNLGFIDSEFRQEYKSAIDHYTDAIKADAEYYQAYYMRGFSYERLRDVKNAELEYLAALQLNREYQKALDGLKRIGKKK